jgi:hypothetical protein
VSSHKDTIAMLLLGYISKIGQFQNFLLLAVLVRMVKLKYRRNNVVSIMGDTPDIVVGKQNRFCRYLYRKPNIIELVIN